MEIRQAAALHPDPEGQARRSARRAPTTLAAALGKLHDFGDVFFSKEFVEPRPLLQALEQAKGCVLLVDEIDKSDAEFESLLLEILSPTTRSRSPNSAPSRRSSSRR